MNRSAFRALVVMCFFTAFLFHSSPDAVERINGPGLHHLSAQQAFQLLSEDGKDVVIVDVRTEKEVKAGVIEGAVHVGMGEIFSGKYPFPADQPVIVYCAVGGRSYVAARWLKDKGVRELYNLKGGIESWRSQGFPTFRTRD